MPTTGEAVGPYTLIKKLGSGAFGTVWLAERRTAIITTKVAIKLPLIENIDLDAVKKEAELWALISGHPNILPIIEANIYNSQVVIVSEYVAGGTLDQFLRIYDGRMLDTKRAVEIVAGILSGLEYLHSKKIIHRDLKPANILLQEGIPRIADFGISRLMKTSTHSNRSSGTPSYMSPEAFTGMRSHQTDIWSVGVILYQMLSGKLPFPGENPMEIMFSITMREPQALPASVPVSLQKVVERALQKDINLRYKNSLDMRNDLWNTVVNGNKLPIPEFNFDKVLNQNQATSTNVSLKQISLSLDDSIAPLPIDTLKNRIVIKKGDILLEKVDAIVNPTDRIFSGRIGIDNRVHIVAGPKLREECDKLGTCPPGEARITRGHKLSAAWVIHTCGPTWKDINSAEIDILANCYKNCFELARQQNIKSIAMPPIRTEAIGFPLEKAAAVAIKEIKTFLESDQTIERVILVGFTTKEYNCFINAMEDAFK